VVSLLSGADELIARRARTSRCAEATGDFAGVRIEPERRTQKNEEPD
jgi:hypothetical protein